MRNPNQQEQSQSRRGDFARGQRQGSDELRYDPDYARGQRDDDEFYRDREPDYAEGMRDNRSDDSRRMGPAYARGQRSYPESSPMAGDALGQDSWARSGEHTGRGPKGYQRSNERVREDICERLTRHGQVDASDIDVQVQDGEVTLAGTVDTRQAKRLAEDTAFSVSGVRDVHNQLRVGYGAGAMKTGDRSDR
jgi:hypothetical protein